MRREIAFSLAGFLGGFVVAAFVFWQPSHPKEAEQKAAIAPVENAARRAADAPKIADHARRPVVVSAGNSEAVEPVAAPVAAPKKPSELFHEALASLGELDAKKRQAAVNQLVNQLRAAGPEGLQAVRDFFRAGQDVKFKDGYAIMNGRMTQMPSLRVAMLDALGEWPGTEATELSREVLRSTPRMFEAAIAIRQLEAKSPGTYRAEAIQTLQQLANEPQGKDGMFDGGNTLFDAMGYFKAPELIPAAEKLVQKNGWAAFQYVQALEKFSPDVRGPAIERLFAQPEVVKQLTANPWALQGMNYSDRAVSQNVAQIFETGMDRKVRENFLQNFAGSHGSFVAASSFDPSAAKGAVVQPMPEATRVAQLQAKLTFLDQIAPQCNTAVLQERLQDARDDVKKAIAQPSPSPGLTRGGVGTLQLGGGLGGFNVYSGGTTVIETGGTATIQAGTIEVKPAK